VLSISAESKSLIPERNFSAERNDSESRISYSHKETKSVGLNWKTKDGRVLSSTANIGLVLLRSGQANGIELEGACEGVHFVFQLLILPY